MIRWLVIHSDPPLQIHDATARPYIDPGQRAEQILVGMGSLRADVAGEVANITINARNADGESARALSRPPLGVEASVMQWDGAAAVELFRGVVSAVALDDAGSITVQSAITGRAPLRDTTAWPGYREARWIPRRYGVCGGEALQYDGTRRLWVWADGASAAVDTVFVNDQRSAAWTWRNGTDAAGRVVTYIEFAAPVPEGQRVIARGRGALHPVRGGLMESPAEVLWGILANLGGMQLPEARLAAFGQQCAEAGLVVGGSVESNDKLFEIARELCDSIGAVCSPDMLGFARLWPGYDPPAVAVAERRAGVGVTAAAAQADVCQDLTMRYAIEAGEPRGAVQYRVAGAPANAPARVVDAPWISSARVAALVCARLLAQQCRAQWEVTASGLPGQLRIGQAVDLQHPRSPVSGAHMILSRELSDTGAGLRSSVTVRAAVGAVPPLVLVRNTSASEALPTITATAAAPGDELEVQIVDESGAPLANASCTLDGAVTRTADSAGRVRFPARYATAGAHEIVATVPGRPPVVIQLTVT